MNATLNNPNGWSVGSAQLSSSNISNSSTAATYLTSTYYNYTWTRS